MNKLRGNQLHPDDRKHVLAAFIYRQTFENQRANQADVKRAGSRLPLITDEQWLRITEFPVRKDGRLDSRVHYCETHHFEIPTHAALIKEWAAERMADAL